ncbi:MAG: M16 family metallopeptidase, partial [Prevotella sp.]
GDICFDRLVKMLEKATADLPAYLPMVNRKEYPTLPPQTGNRWVEIQKNTHQNHVMMGNRAYPVGHPHRIALYLLNNLLGGPGMSTRLNLALRERNGLVYSVDSSMLSYADTGTWCVYFGCDAHDTTRCMHLVRRELDRLMLQPLSDNAVRNAKRQLKGQIAVACDNRENFALDFAKGFLHYGWHKDVTALYEEIDALDAALLQKVAQEIFDSEAMTTLIYT